jgi:predicted glycogen debranching enzyme
VATRPHRHGEWLEADGLGGFASGTADGVRTRRYHALLLAATRPPDGRFVLVNGFEAWVDAPAGTFPITSQLYAPGVLHPDGRGRIESFQPEPWPTWRLRLEDGTRIEQELFVAPGAPCVSLAWRLVEPRPGVSLRVRPLVSGRDPHSLHHENPAFRFEAEVAPGLVVGGSLTVHDRSRGSRTYRGIARRVDRRKFKLRF